MKNNDSALNPEKQKKEYRKFGLMVGFILAAVFGLMIPYIKSKTVNPYFSGVGLVLMLAAGVYPSVLKYPYNVWMKIGEVLGWINTRIILGFVFFAVIAPIGVLRSVFGKNPMKPASDAENSFRKKSEERDSNHFEKPF